MSLTLKNKFVISLAISAATVSFAEPATTLPSQNNALPFGQSFEKVKQQLSAQCAEVIIHENQLLEVPTATQTQSQIDCLNFQPLHHQGTSEWVFADDTLDIVWVLSPLEQLNTMKMTLAESDILPEYSLPEMADFYLERGFGLRYQPTEFLYFSDRLKPYYRAWLDSL